MPGEDVQQAKEAFGVRLRELRQEASLTGRALAQLTGLHYTKISRVENGRQSVTDAEIRAWCAACGASDQVPELIAMARTVESMYREWRRQTRAGMRHLQESSAPLYERTRLFRIYEHTAQPLRRVPWIMGQGHVSARFAPVLTRPPPRLTMTSRQPLSTSHPRGRS